MASASFSILLSILKYQNQVIEAPSDLRVSHHLAVLQYKYSKTSLFKAILKTSANLRLIKASDIKKKIN